MSDPDVVVRSLTAERVARLAAEALKVPADRAGDWRLRAITGYLGRQKGRIPLTKTALFFGRHGTTLVRDVRRLEREIADGPDLRELVESVRARIADAALQH